MSSQTSMCVLQLYSTKEELGLNMSSLKWSENVYVWGMGDWGVWGMGSLGDWRFGGLVLWGIASPKRDVI